MAFGVKTYSDVVGREGLLDILRDISPQSTQLTEMLSRDTSQGLKMIRQREEAERKKEALASAKLMGKWLTLMK